MTAQYGAALFFTSLLGMLLGIMLWEGLKWSWRRARERRREALRRKWKRAAEMEAHLYMPSASVATARTFHPDGRVTVEFYFLAAPQGFAFSDPHAITVETRWSAPRET